MNATIFSEKYCKKEHAYQMSFKTIYVILAAFTKDYWANFSETFRNISKSFDDRSVIHVILTYDYSLEILSGILESAGKSNV